MKKLVLLSLLALAAPAPTLAEAQTPAVPAATPEPARLAASERLLTVLMPPARVQAVIDGMIAAMARNMQQAMQSNGELAAMIGEDPRVRPIVDRYLQRITTETIATMRTEQPAMMAAMARAHARRFTVAQLGELEAFFATPTGQLYMDQGATIIADPDVAAWQQKMMRQQLGRAPETMRAMMAELMALPPRSGS